MFWRRLLRLRGWLSKMAKYVIDGSTLTGIADAIRAKNGSSDTMTPAKMAEEIAELTTEEQIAHADIPDYVKAAALEVARKVNAVRTDNSIVFIAMSDSHYYGEQGSAGVDTYVDANGTQGNVSNLHGAMAAKVLAYALDVDFFAHLGDLTWGNSTTNSDLLHSQVETFRGYISEAFKNIPVFICIGNHDTGIYYHNAQISAGNTGVYTESGSWLYENFTALSDSDDTVISGEDNGGYCYRDFSDKKLRVFMLNTGENDIVSQSGGATLGSQQAWFANALVDLNSKDDASQWSWMLLCHYPADYGSTMPLSELIKAYVEGTSISITDENGATTTVDFSGNNGAKMIAQFHGHVHNFKTSKLHSYATGSAVEYDAYRMCIPNGQYNRENYYSTVGNYTDIDFSEDQDYPKTVGTAQDTSFVVNVIDPEEQVIYSFCYGAGYDRTVGYGETVYYSVTGTLSNATMTDAVPSVAEGEALVVGIFAGEHSVLTSITVTMGGVDVTESYVTYNGDDTIAQVSIPSVTGNVVITAVAEIAWACTNQIPISTDTDGSIFNGCGYRTKSRLTGEGEVGNQSGTSVTGFIPVSNGDVIRMQDMYIAAVSTCRLCFYDSDKTFIGFIHGGNSYDYNKYLSPVTDEDGNYIQFTINTSLSVISTSVAYMRVTAGMIMTDASILTVNEEIAYYC